MARFLGQIAHSKGFNVKKNKGVSQAVPNALNWRSILFVHLRLAKGHGSINARVCAMAGSEIRVPSRLFGQK